jgi:preprotein translocase subunit SecF
MIDIVGKRNWFFLISLIIIIPGLISLAVSGLKLGIDFSSGTTMTLQFTTPVDQGKLRQEMSTLGFSEATIQKTGTGDYLIRVREISTDEKNGLINGLNKDLTDNVTIRDFYAVTPLVAGEVARNAGIAIVVTSIFMLLYIAWAFRRVPNPFRWGTCAVISLLHDVLIVLGIFSILGWAVGMQVDSMFITAMLTVVGYSMHNTIVVFDRIRENFGRGISKDFAVTVNASILETIARCVNTSLTVTLVVLAIFLFGGATTKEFMLAMLLGVIAGTYNSICIAGPLLVLWDRGLAKSEPKSKPQAAPTTA